MTAEDNEAEILSKIQDTYVPFLEKFIAFIENKKDATPNNLHKLKAIYTVFTTAASQEQVDTFYANKKKLEKWYKKVLKKKNAKDVKTTKENKRPLIPSDTECFQEASGDGQRSSKMKCIFMTSVNAEPSQPSIVIDQSINQHSTSSKPNFDAQKEKDDSLKVLQPVNTYSDNFQPATVQQKLATISAHVPTAASQDSCSSKEIIFKCASCKFESFNETKFMDHTRTQHKLEHSMCCRECGRFFKDTFFLVSHIKERTCIKEEMNYKCKSCSFETAFGFNFTEHLRLCHGCSPFIYCTHCNRMFTSRLLLMVHMQNECKFKETNRRNPCAAETTVTPIIVKFRFHQ